MIDKLKAIINWLLESKVGNGFAFILYMVMCFALGLILKANFEVIAASLFAGLGVQTGQRTYTKVTLTKAELNCSATPATSPKEPA
jgi:hypothetical protein